MPTDANEKFVLDATKYEGHTPGPWKCITWDASGLTANYIRSGEFHRICEILGFENRSWSNDCLSNAKLIADAPQLLAALIETKSALEQTITQLGLEEAQSKKLADVCEMILTHCDQEDLKIESRKALSAYNEKESRT